MALANYTDLQASIADWLARTDLTARIPDFVTLAEAQMNRRLRVRQMVASATSTVSTETAATPTDFLDVITFTLGTSDEPLRSVTSAEADRLAYGYNGLTDQPTRYALVGGEFRFLPAPNTSYGTTLLYYRKIPPLASNATNWLLTSHPDAYLYGSVLQAAPFLKEDERIPVWASLYENAVRDIEASDAKGNRGGRLRTDYPVRAASWSGVHDR